MKKLFLFVAAIVALSTVAKAQEFTYGLRGGLNLATVDESIADMKPSFYLGAFAEWRLNDIVAIAPEFYYSREGCAMSEGSYKEKLRMNYLNVPVLVKLYLLDELSLDLGPQVGFLMNAKAWAKADGDTETEDMGDFVKSTNISFGMGLTYNLNSNIFFQGRYNLGLSNISEESNKLKGNVLQFGVGYRF